MAKIYLGEQNKIKIIEDYIKENNIKNVFIIGDNLNIANEMYVPFKEVIMYKWFYPLLQSIQKDSLVVLNNILKKRQRNCLEYNCIRHYCENTNHILVFNYYPIIEEKEDFMILYDMIQENPFLKEDYKYIIKFKNVILGNINTKYQVQNIIVDKTFFERYEKLKNDTINSVKKDPDIIPQRLLKLSETESKKQVKDFDKLTDRKPNMKLVANNSKVDKYFFEKYLKWRESVEDVKSKI